MITVINYVSDRTVSSPSNSFHCILELDGREVLLMVHDHSNWFLIQWKKCAAI
jgi:hypothetical protein